MAAVQFGTSGKSYRLGARNLVRTSGGVLYACVLNNTDGLVEIWKYSSGSWAIQGTSPNAYKSGATGSVSCAIDSNGIINVVYYGSSTTVCWNCYNTNGVATNNYLGTSIAANSWGVALTIYTKTIGTYNNYVCAVAVDSNNAAHVILLDWNSTNSNQQWYYENNVAGGNGGGGGGGIGWNSAVSLGSQFTTVSVATFGDIAIDTAAGGNHRTNIPQMSFQISAYNRCALGNANNATSFTVSGLTPSLTSGSGVSIVIDSSGKTTSFSWYNSSGKYLQAMYIAGDSAWGFIGSWIQELNISGASTAVNWLAAAIDANNNRYVFPFYTSTSGIFYSEEASYGSPPGSQTQLESPSATGTISVLWSYANLQPYATYGIDYLFTAGTGTNNLYWDNLGTMIVITGSVAANLTQESAAVAGTPVASGVLAAALAQESSDFEGKPIVSGSAAPALAQESSDFEGTPLITATAAPLLSQVLAALAGSPLASASLAALLSQVSTGLNGSPVVSGSLAAILAQVSANAAGTPIVSASLAPILTALYADLQGSPLVSGFLVALLSQLNANIQGSPLITGATLAAALAQVTANVQGSPQIKAALAAALSPESASLQGAPVASGSLAALLVQTLANIQGTPVTGLSVSGVLAAVMAPLAAEFSGTPEIAGALSPALAAISTNLEGLSLIIGHWLAMLAQINAGVEGFPIQTPRLSSILRLPPEPRIFSIGKENRTLVLPPQDRTLKEN